MGNWFKMLTVMELLGKGGEGVAQSEAQRRWALLLVLILAHS